MTAFISLEKIIHSTPELKREAVALRIVSTDSFQTALDKQTPTILIVHKHEKLEAKFYFEAHRETLSTEKWKGGFLISWPSDLSKDIKDLFLLHSIHSQSFEKPIWDHHKISESKQLLSVPAFGFIDKRWCDGWMAHFSQTGKVLSLIPPGTQSRLYVPLEEKNAVGMEWAEASKALPSQELLNHQSVLLFLRLQDIKSNLQVQNFNLEEAVCLLLIRQAFPEKEFEVHNPSPKKQWPARFKNFLESIKMDWKQGEEGQDLKSLFARLDKEQLLNLVSFLNKPTKIFDGIPT